MGDDELKSQMVTSISLLAEQQKQLLEFQALFARQLTSPSHESRAENTGSVSNSHLAAFKFVPFDETSETFSDFVDRLESYFTLQAIKKENQAGCLVAALSPKLFKLLKNLLYPESYDVKTFAELRDLLKAHLNPVPLVIPSRHALFTRRQAEGETIAEYIAELQQLATYCKYNSQVLAVVLRDVFVSGLRSKTILDRLFQEDDPSLAEVIRIAQSIERAEGATNEVLQFTPTASAAPEAAAVNLVKTATETVPRRQPWQRPQKRSPAPAKQPAIVPANAPSSTAPAGNVDVCYSCGEKGHRRPACTKTNLHCDFCNRANHVEAVCQTKRRQSQASVKQMDTSSVTVDNFPYEEFTLYQLTDPAPKDDKIFVRVWINKKAVIFELDSGSKRTVVNAETYAKIQQTTSLKPTLIQLLDYSGNLVTVTGEAQVTISDYKRTVHQQSVLVVNNRSNVLGRDWMVALGWLTDNSLTFDRVDVHSHSSSVHTVEIENLPRRLQQLLSANKEIFGEATGKAVYSPTALELQPNARPVFRKARPIPMALRASVEQEINKLVREEIWQPVTTADWATPIVPVVKPVGVRICGDYSCTLNPQLRVA